MRIRNPGWKKFGSGIRERKTSDPGSGMEKIRVRNPGKKKVGSGMEKIRVRNPGKKPGSGINIPDPQHCRKGCKGFCASTYLYSLLLFTFADLSDLNVYQFVISD
jgi:hypothetical protein